MEFAKIKVTRDSAKILKYSKVPSGLIGGTITVEYDSFWMDLQKKVVFKGADEKTIFTNESIIEIPKEVVTKAGPRLQIGFIGTDTSRNLLLPSLYVDLGQIRQGADSSGDSTTDSTLPGWAQLEGRMDDLEDMVENGFTGPQGPPGEPGPAGPVGPQGPAGNDYVLTPDDKTEIAEMAAELVDVPGSGGNAENGVDGFSPIATVEQTDTGAVITITDKTGTTTATITNGKDGVDGKDGSDGYTPVKGKDYFDGNPGADGEDGVTPHIGSNGNWFIGNTDTGKPSRGADGQPGQSGSPGSNGSDGVSATHSWNGTVLTITSASGTSSADLKGEKGDKGDTGSAGKDGTSVTVTNVVESNADGGSNVVTFSDGKTVTIKNGKTGATGGKGADGKTPVRGTDYYTDADKTEMVNAVLAALPTWTGGSY